MKLKKGKKYDIDKLSLLFWQAGSKVVIGDHPHIGDHLLYYYFDDDGRYLGPDGWGVEPVVKMKEVT